jgi:nickel-dependent lactate racemase
MAEIKLRTGVWAGDAEKSFAFPEGWEVVTYPPADAEPLSDEAIREALLDPIGTARLSELGQGKRSAVVIVDDLSRPTPAFRVIPFVLEELHRAGVPEEGICFVIGGGSHRPMTPDEAAKKVGAEVASRYRVVAHDAYSGTLVGLGNLENGTPIYISEVVARSELKIALSCVVPHGEAGFGGGAKLILPGVAGIATIVYNHRLLATRPRGLLERAGAAPDLRDNAEQAARRVGVDLGIHVLVNSRREVAGVFAGDVVQAHHAACRCAQEIYDTPIPERDVTTTDIVVSNAYPQDYYPPNFGKSLWPRGVFKNAFQIVIDPCTDATWYHGLHNGIDYGRFVRLRRNAPGIEKTFQPEIGDRGQIIALSTGHPPDEFYTRYPDGALFTSWADLIAALKRVCPVARVAVLPCSPLQLFRRV